MALSYNGPAQFVPVALTVCALILTYVAWLVRSCFTEFCFNLNLTTSTSFSLRYFCPLFGTFQDLFWPRPQATGFSWSNYLATEPRQSISCIRTMARLFKLAPPKSALML